MQIVYKKIDELKPYKNNPRKNDNAVEYVANSIREFGFKVPIIIDTDNEIIAGHTRLKAAQKISLTEVPVIIANDLTGEQIKAFRLADNKTAEIAFWDYELLDHEMVDIFDIALSDFGFCEEEKIDFANLDKMTEGEEEGYAEFEEKFKPKKTTDDCYTPPKVYEAIKDWVIKEYHFDDAEIIRPFYPGGDYKRHKYPDGCVVIDNPPFSILAEIKRFYQEKGIRYFLFGPHLTLFSSNIEESYIITNTAIIYENGANISTSFVTNMDKYKIRTAPDLVDAIEKAIQEGEESKELPKYEYPKEVVSTGTLGKINKVDFKILPEQCHFIRRLDAQKETNGGIYGSGFLISKKAAAEKAATKEIIFWKLSDREKEIVEELSKNESVNNGDM